MHATIDVRFEFSINDDKTYRSPRSVSFLTEQDIEATLPEALVTSLDEQTRRGAL